MEPETKPKEAKEKYDYTDEMIKLSINEEDKGKRSLKKKLIVLDINGGKRSLKKKLIVLDINGVLADIVSPPPKHIKADATISRKALFKRPFYLEFLNFCLEKFEVGVWSSRTKKNIDKVIDHLMENNMRQRLLFCWDLSYCTQTSYKTLENKNKPLVFKDLRKIWEKHDPNLPWEKGYYNESNTLLLDDSPYKALLNPRLNVIFPNSFSFQNQNDNSLAVEGDLREFMNRLANSENMLKYIEQHPFGQEPISERSKSWSFYLKVIDSISPSQQKNVSKKDIVQLA